MSFTATLLPILAVLGCAEQFLDIQTPWQPVNYKQVTLLHHYYPNMNQLLALSNTELSSIASYDVNPVNQFLRDHNFSIQLAPEPNSVCYSASVLNILVKWAVKGDKAQLYTNNQFYQAVQLKEGYAVYAVPDYEHELIKIETSSGDIVYMTIADKPCQDFELLATLRSITNHPVIYDITDEYTDLIFPMVDLNQEVDISWLENMYVPLADSTIPEMWIARALQQTKFQMNEEGAAAQSAVAIAMVTKMMPIKSSLVIDKPFYLWIVRKGVMIPLFAGYIDYTDWKEPARLG
jgi:hypothetical protein